MIPTSTAPLILSSVTSLVSDTGMFGLITVVMAVGLVFYIIKGIANILKMNKEIDRADKVIKESNDLLKKSGFNSRYESALRHYNNE